MKQEELLKITYKGQDYSLKELIEENNQFMKSLAIPDEINMRPSSHEFVFLGDYGYIIAINKFGQLYNLLATARFALTQAHQSCTKVLSPGVRDTWGSFGYAVSI